MKPLLPAALMIASIGFTACAASEGGPDGDDLAAAGGGEQSALTRTISPRIVLPVPCGEPKIATSPSGYKQPADDGIALGTLIDGAGYGASTNSDWTDIASGNFCGGSEKELVLLKNRHSNFSIMRGPVPYAVGAFDAPSDPSHPWRAVTAGDLDADGIDEIVAARKVTAKNVPDVFVIRMDPKTCGAAKASPAIFGFAGDSDWLDAAIGNFDGKGKQVALLKASGTHFYLGRPFGDTLGRSFSGDLDSNASYPWRGIAAGDLDGDGIDELVATRRVSDGKGATVLVYKWLRSTFLLVATSTFGNNGNSAWTGVTVGDFNGDGRAAIALAKNEHSNFAILDLPPATSKLRELATSDLDSAAGQPWRGVTAVDWAGGDAGAAELVAVRAATDPYRTDLFVYGNPFHRIARDSRIVGSRTEWAQPGGVAPADIVASLTEAHATTISWSLGTPDDYTHLVEFLSAAATQSACVDGQRLRVSATILQKFACAPDQGPAPVDSPITPWNELDYFAADGGDRTRMCQDTLAWGSLVGRLAHDYPQLVSFGIDDFGHHTAGYSGEEIAELQSRIRQQAPWVTFVPTIYYGDLSRTAPDYARTIDTWLYYFRNEKAHLCLTDPCGVNSVPNAPGEFAEAIATLPAGRQLQVGTYWGQLWSTTPPQDASNVYDYDLVRLVRSMPEIGGVTAYPVIMKSSGVVCDDSNFLSDEFCTLQRVFGPTP
jgi:hypothetical protein